MAPRTRRRSVALLLAAFALGACSSDSTGSGSGGGAAAADGVDVPLPTIGLGSDTGSGRTVAADPDAITRVVMIGDSITVGAESFLLAGFEAAGLPVDIGAQSGKRIDVSGDVNPAGTRIAEQFAATAGDDVLWVVALGTNDIGQYTEQADVEQEIRDLLTFVPVDAPLVWINTWFRDRPEETVMVNAAIESVMRGRGNATIGDWATLAPVEGVLTGDGVHPNENGAQVFADLVVGTSRNFLQR